MSRRILLLLTPALLALPLCAHAQIRSANEFAWQSAITPDYPPERPWVPDMEVRPKFPVTVRLELQYRRYNGYSYVGFGEGHVFNPTGENVSFRYRCDLTFASYPTEFQARWLKPDSKLEILLRKPGTNHTRTCRLDTVVLPSPRPTGPPAEPRRLLPRS